MNNTLIGLIGGKKIGHTHGTTNVHGIGRWLRIDSHITHNNHVSTHIERTIRHRFSYSHISQDDRVSYGLIGSVYVS